MVAISAVSAVAAAIVAAAQIPASQQHGTTNPGHRFDPRHCSPSSCAAELLSKSTYFRLLSHTLNPKYTPNPSTFNPKP